MNIKVYSTPTCPWCAKLKEWLKQKGIEYEDINVAEDEKAQKEMIGKSGEMGVPQVDVNGKMIVGFAPDAIEAALKDEDEVTRTEEEE